MVKLYLSKIVDGEINIDTNEPWKVEDVPVLWRARVQEALEA